MQEQLNEMAKRKAARRDFLRGASLTAATALAASSFKWHGAMAAEPEATTLTDVDILNFALNLEYLEAEYYLRGAAGHGLTTDQTTGTGSQGAVTGGSKVNFGQKWALEFFREIASDEQKHVNFLRKALGSAAVSEPSINLSTSFTTLARAAGVVGMTDTFDPFASQKNFLIGAYIFEDVGVTAYKGAAASITSKDYLTAAAGILATEAYHAGAIRAYLAYFGYVDPSDKIATLRRTLAGEFDDRGVEDNGPNGALTVADVDVNAIAYSRTPQQVLNIVYGDKTATPGLFFPKGLNGTIK